MSWNKIGRAGVFNQMNGALAFLSSILLTTVSIGSPVHAMEQQPQGPTAPIEFVKISAGDFMMGCSDGDSECNDFEKPAHPVRFTKGFEIGKSEVTQAQWQAVMGSNPSYFEGANLPVENVSWNDIQEFVSKLNAKNDGYKYRLPTEAEWEYAARAGTTGKYYETSLDALAWYGNNSGSTALDADSIWRTDQANYGKRLMDNRGRTHAVAQKQSNAWGLYDVLGNVAEWVQDWYDPAYYQRSPRADPTGPDQGPVIKLSSGKESAVRVLRGGSWNVGAKDERVSNRGNGAPSSKGVFVGFRCVREPD